MSVGNTQKIIQQTETRWLDELYGYVQRLFSSSPLPSHDHDHHLRVWHYAKDLLLELAQNGKSISADTTEKLIIACFFHDTGMVKENGPEHGKASRMLCEEYLKMPGHEVHSRERILEAVENHDDKTYSGSSVLFDEQGLNILQSVSICDDLDAFANTGVYRYTEIYLMRGTAMEDLGLKILANLSGRFSNFVSTCSFLPGMIRTHVPRHNITEEFFRNYNLQLRMIERQASRSDTGPVGVAKEIFRHTMAGASGIPEVCDAILASSQDPFVRSFFETLRNEVDMNQASFR